MKIKKNYVAGIILVGMAVLGVWQVRTIAQKGIGALQLSVNAEKRGYSVGEVIGLEFALTNLSGEEMEIVPPSVGTGNIQVFISTDGRNYRSYKGPGYGMQDSRRRLVKLSSGSSLDAKATVLHNETIPYAHLTKMYADKIRRENLDTVYAIPTSGTYWIKAVYSTGKEKFESEPLMIEITEPVGMEAAIWERIKDNGEYAYFLQTGDMRYRQGTPESEAFVESLRQLSEQHPSTDFAQYTGEKLVKRQEMLDNLTRLRAEREQP